MISNTLRNLVKKFREYGLDHCSLPVLVENISRLLLPLTFNVDPGYNKKIPIASYIFSFAICFSYFYVYLFSVIWFVFFECAKTGDVINAMKVFAIGISSEITTSKMVCMLIYQNSLRNMIGEYLTHDLRGESNVRLKNNLLTVMRRVKKRAIIFWCLIVGNAAAYTCKPLVMPGKEPIEEVEFLYGLQPVRESPNYEIVYVLTFLGTIFASYGTATITGFFIIAIGYIEAQMLSLSQEITSIWEDAQDHYYQNYVCIENAFGDEGVAVTREKHIILNEYVKKELEKIVVYHMANIGFLSQMEGAFRDAIVVGFGLVMIGMVAEFLVGLEYTYLFMIYALVLITMDCITGQKLLDASNEFLRAVYECHWENFDVKNMKTVLLILTMSQKDLSISAGGLITLDFVCLMTVFRMIYSTYTTLSTALAD